MHNRSVDISRGHAEREEHKAEALQPRVDPRVMTVNHAGTPIAF